MMGKTALTPEELQTVTNSDTPCLIITATGTVENNEAVTVYIKDMDTFLCVKLVDDSPCCHWECCAKRWAVHAPVKAGMWPSQTRDGM